MVAYREDIELSESLIAVYKIYCLKNPDTQEIFYIGITAQELKYRLSGHLGDSKKSAKTDYIKSLVSEGKKPIIEEVETVNGRCFLDKIFALERELYWIKHFKNVGCQLTNSSGIDSDGKNKYYQGYLSSIQKGETSWHYYYCGKTHSGDQVYDKERIEADGFQFPVSVPFSPPSYIYEPIDDYNPWENERFLKMIGGVRKQYDERYDYVPCYRDTDPNYYDDDY